MHRSLAPCEQQQRLDGRPGAVSGDGEEIEVHMGALQPLRELLVGEAVSGAGRDQQPLGQHRGGPAGLPREDLLEGRTVQRARPGAESAAGRLVHLAGDLGGQPAHGGAAQRGTVRGREPYGDAQAHQVQIGVEDLVPVGRAEAARSSAPAGRRPPWGAPPGPPRAGAGPAGGGRPPRPVRRAAGRSGTGALRRLPRRGHRAPGAGGQRGRRTARPVQQAGREERTGPLPVLGAAGDDQPHTGRTQPAGRRLGPRGQPLPRASAGGISSGPSSSTSSGRPAAAASRATPSRGGVRRVAGRTARRGDGPAGGAQRPRDRGAYAVVVGPQLRAAQPDGRSRFWPWPGVRRARPAPCSVRSPGPPPAPAPRAPAALWRSPKRANSAHGLGPFDRLPPQPRAARRSPRDLGELPRAGRIQFAAVGGNGRRVTVQQRGQRALGRGLGDRAQRNRETARPAPNALSPGRARPGAWGCSAVPSTPSTAPVRASSTGPPTAGTAQPQRLPAAGAQSQLHGFVEEMDAVGGRVRHPGARPDDRAVEPAARPEPCAGARGRPADGDGQRREPARPEALGPYEGEPGLRKGGDGVGVHHAGPAGAPGRAAPAPSAMGCSTSRVAPSTASWLVITVPSWSARNPVPRVRPARSRMRTSAVSASASSNAIAGPPPLSRPPTVGRR